MLEPFTLLAQDIARYNKGLEMFQWGVTLAGVGILGGGIMIFFNKPKKSEKAASLVVQQVVGGIFALFGAVLIAFAWLGFSPM